MIYDTPGMMWQKIQYEQIGNNLAICNSIGRRALDEESLAFYLLNYLKIHYEECLVSRYKLTEVMLQLTDVELLDVIGRKRGSILSGGVIDIQKVSEIIIQDFREGRIGKITLETPELWEKWIIEAKNEEPGEDE